MRNAENIETLREVRRSHILKTLENAEWDFQKASVMLNVSENFLRNEVKKIALEARQNHEGRVK